MLLMAVLLSDLVFLKGELVSRLVFWSSDSLDLGFWTPPCSRALNDWDSSLDA